MDSRSGLRLAVLTALILGIATPAAAADPVALGGSPLNVYVDTLGQLQAVRVDATTGTDTGIFYKSSSHTGDAGFFLAFPPGMSSVAGDVYGFEGIAGPRGLVPYTPVPGPGGVTGNGTTAAPLTQVTKYRVHGAADYFEITQTTTYVNGSQEFRVRWVVHALTNDQIPFKAIAAADFFFEGDDAGTGIFTAGPPRFIGGTNPDSGSSGGFVEVLGGASNPWSAYQALRFPDVWTLVQGAGGSADPTFDNSVLAEPDDNAGAVEWDQYVTGPLGNGADATFDLIIRSAVPSALQLNPTNAASRQGVPINVTATALDTNGQPYAGKTLRYTITGANPGTGAATLNATGSAVMTDPGTNAGFDTVVAFVDFNNNGTREAVEPQASALATFVDSVPPTCTLKVSGTRVGGAGAGKPLTINVNCGEGATVTVLTSMEVLGGGTPRSAAKKKKKRIRIKLKSVTRAVTAGKATAFKLKIPKKVAHRYAGRKVKFTLKVTAKDSAGNVKRIKRSKTTRLAVPKSKKKRRR
jgi:hypothetical protein